MTDYRRNFIAGGSFFFERPWDVQQGDGFRKGSTHPTRYAAAAANPLIRQEAVSSGQIFVTPSGGYAGSLLLQAEGSVQFGGQEQPTKGIFEYLIPLNTSTLLGRPEITHQRFIPNAPVSGYPNNTKGVFPPFGGL
jgi:hypothetical protein